MLTALRSRVRAWMAVRIPPHPYALLRILLGVAGLISLVGLTPVGLFWPLDGLVPVPRQGAGVRSWIAHHGLGTAVGTALFGWLLCAFMAITAGFRSDLAVFLGFVGLVAQAYWNPLPLSSAHQVMTVLLFCLLWAETGRVWSLDARWLGPALPASQPAWPLRLMQAQVAIVYLSSGLYKLASPVWRDGTAVHWALNLNIFHRMPWPLPAQLAPLEVLLTWGTLAFELSFWLLVLFRRTRPLALVGGIALHAGLFATLELGPFSVVMVASYVCYLDPDRVARLLRPASGPSQVQ
jgi:hypothetical protein